MAPEPPQPPAAERVCLQFYAFLYGLALVSAPQLKPVAMGIWLVQAVMLRYGDCVDTPTERAWAFVATCMWVFVAFLAVVAGIDIANP